MATITEVKTKLGKQLKRDAPESFIKLVYSKKENKITIHTRYGLINYGLVCPSVIDGYNIEVLVK